MFISVGTPENAHREPAHAEDRGREAFTPGILGKSRPIASLSLDLDNQWSYMKTHGDPGWERFPSYLDLVVPRVLRLLEALHLKITFFVVGQDAALPQNERALRSITAHGHEVGNHSFNHEPWLHRYTRAEVERDLGDAEASIERATGVRPVGFRGPGFSHSPATLEVLAKRAYLYDASTFPTFLGPLARAYYFLSTRMKQEEMEKRVQLFGSLWEGFRPLKPYAVAVNGSRLIEIPVTTMPFARTPIHLSYVLYLATFSRAMALAYFRGAVGLCLSTGVQLSLLLHPLDFLGCDDINELSFFPAMKVRAQEKLDVAIRVLRTLSQQFTVLTMRRHAEAVSRVPGLQVQDC